MWTLPMVQGLDVEKLLIMQSVDDFLLWVQNSKKIGEIYIL